MDVRLVMPSQYLITGRASSHVRTHIFGQIGKVAQAMLVAGRNGVEGLPEAAKSYTSTAGGDTPFTIVDNHGTWALADNFS